MALKKFILTEILKYIERSASEKITKLRPNTLNMS